MIVFPAIVSALLAATTSVKKLTIIDNFVLQQIREDRDSVAWIDEGNIRGTRLLEQDSLPERVAANSILSHMSSFSRMLLARTKLTKQKDAFQHPASFFKTRQGPKSVDSTFARLKASADTQLDSLTLAVVSDTHGYEGQLCGDPENMSDLLPEGDILMHLGDFARDGSRVKQQAAIVNFDYWLAKQPHKYKIIVRGNHDPFYCEFPQSGAWYVRTPATFTLGGLVVALIPFAPSTKKLTSAGNLPRWCDVIATHFPPHKCRDRTTSGKDVGCRFTTNIVKKMRNKTPRLWLCGHIHEGRGTEKRSYGGRETVVINAANANSGRATHLEHGPVVVSLNRRKMDQGFGATEWRVKILENGDGKLRKRKGVDWEITK